MPLPAAVPAALWAGSALLPIVAPHAGRLAARHGPRIWRGIRGAKAAPKPRVVPSSRPTPRPIKPPTYRTPVQTRIRTGAKVAAVGAGGVVAGGILLGGGPLGIGGVPELIARKGLKGAWDIIPASVKASVLWVLALVAGGLFAVWTARDLLIRWILR